jgi:general secretion pathway protein E
VNASVQELAVPGKTLPFAFARRHGIVLRELRDGVAHCAVRSNATPSAVVETRRLLRIPLSLERVGDEEFERLLQAAYEGGAGTLAAAGGGLEENADLANLALELPEQGQHVRRKLRVQKLFRARGALLVDSHIQPLVHVAEHAQE